VDGKELRPLLQFGRLTRLPELPDVPTGREIAKDDKAKALLEFAELPFFMALPFAAPPDVRPTAPERCNRPSWRCATTRASSTRRKGSGSTSARSTVEQIASLLARAAGTPKDVIDRFNEIEKK